MTTDGCVVAGTDDQYFCICTTDGYIGYKLYACINRSIIGAMNQRKKLIVYWFELKLDKVQLLGSAIARLGLVLNFGK